MISFNLVCTNGHEFEGWFRSSKDFAHQSEKQLVACPECGDTGIEKSLMAPVVGAKDSVVADRSEKTVQARELRKLLGEVRDYVETNFDDVGDDFTDEARKIYYGETDERPIYGNATDEDAKKLAEEGVPVGKLPWVKRADS
ncbi:MAG: hypothetical protein CL573_06365 [Alphaproteobacteria bacterium]|nr:hypothetical protein [Alphaproteobacteria bacterium]HCP01342.1 DUF1178 domain-containing protein [Rhodospirillaceae bacterium]